MNSDLQRPITIGRISYTNVWPVVHGFETSALPFPVEQQSGMPAVLNRKLREGEIDMAAISSFAFGVSSNDYYVLPNLSVSTAGRVQSILLFLKSPLEKVLQGTIALTTTSATSVNLLKIIMEKFYGGKPSYIDAEPSLEQMLEHADAALLIGDHAIRASWQNKQYQVLDLGEVWHLWTGHWMTYALWAVHRETAEQFPEAILAIYEALVASKQRTAMNPEVIVDKAITQIGGTALYWRNYFANLCHDFGSEQKAGLQLYWQYALELGLIKQPVELIELPLGRNVSNLI
ncbi:MAG: menaquinone biosynthesis protein [Candidatus Cohnella colombiensis]|uniref:Chorismate dehydratase n=1 Tax=Candidatus Cohnella colombiensis TaxID=3121368 RepID=A0AA95EY92_9BACL|nr:MAG: menaquinone biosynthesis protein [Cohnella sp.]